MTRQKVGYGPAVPADANAPAPRRTDTYFWRYAIIVLIGIVGISASIGMFAAICQWQAHAANVRFTNLAQDDLQTINSSLRDDTDLLYTLRAYFESLNHRVSRAEFQAFSRSLRQRVVGLRDTGWAPRVTAAERDAFEQEVRASGFPDFQITERNADGKFVRAQQRAEYFPILYSDPGKINLPVLGFDLTSESLRRRTIAHARDTDRAAATPPLKLVNVQRPNGGAMSFILVHGRQDAIGAAPGPVAGVLLAAFDTSAMIENILTSKALLNTVDLYVFDPNGPTGKRLIYWHSVDGKPVPSEAALLTNRHWQGTLQLVDQKWDAIFVPTDAFDPGVAHFAAPGVLFGGMIVVASIIGYLWFSLRHTKALERSALLVRVSEERFRTLITATTQIVWITNAAGESVGDSPSWREFTGQDREEMRGHGWIDAIHPDDAVRGRTQWDHAIADKTVPKSEYRLRGRDGKYREVASYGVPLLDPDGTIREWVGACTDVTDRKRLDEALRQSQGRLSLATESARIGIWDWDVAANRLVWDARMYELYGIREQDFSGAYGAWKAGLHPHDLARCDAAITAAIERIEDFHIEFRVVWPNGEVHDIEARALVQVRPTAAPREWSVSIGILLNANARKTKSYGWRARTI